LDVRARTHIAQKPRYTATLTDFKGVDLNTSPLRVATNRASFMKNFICDNGVNHKRPGWEEQLRLDGQIYGIFPFDEGGTEVLLIHAGEGIYRAEQTDGRWITDRLDSGRIRIHETRSQCFYRGGRAFIIGCGNYLVYGKFGDSYALKEVAEIAYVPTTTIGIGGSDEVQETLDAVNLLTRKRKNTAVGGMIEMEGSRLTNVQNDIRLDAIPVPETIVVEVEGIIKCLEGGSVVALSYRCKLVGNKDGALVLTELEGECDHLWKTATGSNSIKVGGTAGRWYGTDFDANTILLEFGAQPLIDNQPNITITFDAATDEAYDERRIQDCRFGVLFGANGADDRLFLAGNDRYPNADIWSEWNDFTYFPDGNTMEVGGSSSAITAYARLSDTTLAIMKEEKAGEPTIFYRTGRERAEEDGITLTQWFPVSAGIAGDGTINPHAVATLSGDVLTLTRNGVHALVLSSNVASGERYTRERSRPIYRELASAVLADAAATVYRNRYYLALPDKGKCYVADAHYKATFEGSTDFNYEWWVWENVPAACFAEYKDQLIFGTTEGRVCAFTEGVFTDRTYTEVGGGNLLLREDGAITYSIATPPDGYDRVRLDGEVYAEINGERLALSGKELYVADVDSEAQCFTVALDPDLQCKLQLSAPGGEMLTGRYVHVTPVTAEWVTPIMDFGTNNQSKTLLQLTVATEPGIEGNVTFGYETRRILRHLQADRALAMPARSAVEIGSDRDFSFDDIDFNNFSFDTAFACSYTKRMCLRNFNFIQFRFGSDTDEDCAVAGVTLIYKINQNNRGVR
jgi:hypothetical protein